MASRYWVGGTAAWDGTAGTKWALTSGGAGGQAVPTSSDDVFFTNLSTGTCTISAGNTGAKSIDRTGHTGTLAGTTAITVSGSVNTGTAGTFSYSGTLTINAAATISGNRTWTGQLTINAPGATVVMPAAWTSSAGLSGALTLTAGTLDCATNNTDLTFAGGFNSSNSNTRAILMGTGTWTFTGATGVWNTLTNTGLTVTTSTSTIDVTNAAGSARTFAFGNNAAISINKLKIPNSTAQINISGALTLGTLELAAGATLTHNPSTALAITTLTSLGTATSMTRLFSNTRGTQVALTIATQTVNYIALEDINVAAANLTVSLGADLNNNTGITFIGVVSDNVFGALVVG